MSFEHSPTKFTDAGSGNTYLTSAQVRERYGGVSDMTIWRWMHDPLVSFPEPTLRINRRRLWSEEALDQFDKQCAEG